MLLKFIFKLNKLKINNFFISFKDNQKNFKTFFNLFFQAFTDPTSEATAELKKTRGCELALYKKQ
jgi:hypothetical protein